MANAVEIGHISKKFRLRHEQASYLSLREQMTSIFRRKKSSSEEFYALNDISFNIAEGESVGIIGKNGAGKSTLLKILSRITPPTSGKVKIRGRLASLLEVGTGFHMELTGRENIFLNGIFLGMTNAEVKKQFDAIVDFSGTEKFLDTPLKHFSSGMQLRLAFAVAAFLEPEIMVIDEVLAVGDAEFQKKCIGKMDEVSRSGRTILFVSHNMAAIQSLCSNGVYLDRGKMIQHGKVHDVVKNYLVKSLGEKSFEAAPGASKKIALLSVNIEKLPSDRSTILEIVVTIRSDGERTAALDLLLESYTGEPAAFGSIGTFDQNRMLKLKKGENQFTVSADLHGLANGLYMMSIDLTHPHKEYFDRSPQILMFEYAYSSGTESNLLQEWNLGYYKLPVHCEPK